MMKIAFDGQLFLDNEKTGIAWNAHNLLMELFKRSDMNMCCNVFRADAAQRR